MTNGDLQIEVIIGPEAVDQDVRVADVPTVDLWPPGPVKIEVLTQAEYDELASPDADTLFVVIN